MTPDLSDPGHQAPEPTGDTVQGGDVVHSLEAAVLEVRAMHPSWPATLVREVAGRLVGVLAAPVRDAEPPPARVLAGLASVVTPTALRDAPAPGDSDGNAA